MIVRCGWCDFSTEDIEEAASHAVDCKSNPTRGETELPRCPECGYTQEDVVLYLDHHLCNGEIPS